MFSLSGKDEDPNTSVGMSAKPERSFRQPQCSLSNAVMSSRYPGMGACPFQVSIEEIDQV
jgi:hypothetical protein